VRRRVEGEKKRKRKVRRRVDDERMRRRGR
jgi:hypothetical protein